MAWKAHRLVYRALSPVHIGWHKLGFIQRTRYYITGRNMWGSMTASLARRYPTHGISNYKKFGAEVMNRNVIASYFYPALDPEAPLVPSYGGNRLSYGGRGVDEFERLLISASGKTAVAPRRNAAEDDTLHETEFISHISADGRPVYFVGYLFIKVGATLDCNGAARNVGWCGSGIDVKPAIEEIFVGGERKYGFGRLALDKGLPMEAAGGGLFGAACGLSGGDIVLDLKNGDSIPAHLKAGDGIAFAGDVETLVGREWNENGAGQKVSAAVACWTPGSVAKADIRLKVSDCGMLETANG